ncbi:MAG: DUF1778 domain-containing protein [Stigonema ocellatum SAG 48.90 = DSM 106950]|nr:DUF1778 domain-containing protein [Stigonema ocellatum SAG 48.90 = DSM 106950]
MLTPSETETTTIELTISQEHKETLEKAAAKKSLSLNQYLLEIALNAAKASLTTPEKIVLSERDWDIFVSALENPPEPNEALKAAIKEYHEEYGKW